MHLGKYIRNGACYMTNIYIHHIYNAIYDISVYLMTFDLGLHQKVNSMSQSCQVVVSHKSYII